MTRRIIGWLANIDLITRTMEVVIARLIRWAHAVFQTSVNQPLLPYAIIIINALEDKVLTSIFLISEILLTESKGQSRRELVVG
jgi:hypothetical protein